MKQKTKQTVASNITPSISIETVNLAFRESVGKPKEGDNTYSAKFLVVITRVLDLMSTFSIHDVRRESIAYEIPEPELNRLFNLWSEEAISKCRLEKINGCYGYDVYVSN